MFLFKTNSDENMIRSIAIFCFIMNNFVRNYLTKTTNQPNQSDFRTEFFFYFYQLSTELKQKLFLL